MEWTELKSLSRLEYIGEDRADVGRQKAAIGVMSSMTKLPASFDANGMLPNPPEKRAQSVEEQFAALDSYSRSRNAKWQPPSEP